MNQTRTVSRSAIRMMAIVIALFGIGVAASEQISAQCTYGWGYVYVTSPSSGQQYTRNTTMNISWYGDRYTIGNYGGTYLIEYSSNGGGTWTTIASKVSGYSTSYSWTIPTTVIPGNNFRIRVSEQPGPSWYCAFSNPGISGTFTIIKGCFPPVMSAQPTSRTVCVGGSTTFSVASDMESGTYEWRKDGVTLAVTGSASYTVNPVTLASAGLYDVVLRDACNPTTAVTTSASAQLTVIEPPVVTVQMPSTKSICENANDTLRIRAIGAGRTFQWRKDGVNIPGATDSNYVINNPGTAANGVYTCVVSGTCSPAATSNPCTITVVLRPKLTLEPNNLDICPGTNGALTMTATGTSLTYQWYRNGMPLSGAVSPTLSFTNYDKSNDGQYYCIATSGAPNPANCQVTTQTRTVRVTGFTGPSVTASPDSVMDACVGTNMTLVSEFSGNGLTFQWFKNGVAIPGAASNSLTIQNLKTSDAGVYFCRATGTCNLTATTTASRVSVISKPVLTTQPQARVLTVGDKLTLSVDATDWRTIQWTKNSQPINGATSPTFEIAQVSKADAGYYNAIVRNSCGGASSAIADIVVNDPAIPTPAIQLSTMAVDFGEIPVGYEQSRQLDGLIKNVGTAPLTVSGIAAIPGQFTITNSPALPLTLAPGQSQGITVKASPTVKGSLTGSIAIQSNDPAKPTSTLDLTAQYVLRYDHEASLNFDTVFTTANKELCVTLTNTSAVDITIEQATLTGASSGSFSVETTLPLAIAAGQTGEVCIKFTPGTAGSKSATVNFRSSTGGNSSMSLAGIGEIEAGVVDASEAGVTASPNPMSDYVDIRFTNATAELMVTVMNSMGQTVSSFRNDAVNAGGTIRWNGRDGSGNPLASGAYTILVASGDRVVRVPITITR